MRDCSGHFPVRTGMARVTPANLLMGMMLLTGVVAVLTGSLVSPTGNVVPLACSMVLLMVSLVPPKAAYRHSQAAW